MKQPIKQKEKLNIKEKLSAIQTKFKSKKSRKNSFGNYMYRSSEDILEALKPFNKEYNIYFIIEESLTLGEFPIIQSCASIVDTITGEKISATAIVGIDINQKGMQMPQKFGSASSYGKKHAFGNLLLIDDTADPDALNTHSKKVLKDLTFNHPSYDSVSDYMSKSDSQISKVEEKFNLDSKIKEKLLKIKKQNNEYSN